MRRPDRSARAGHRAAALLCAALAPLLVAATGGSGALASRGAAGNGVLTNEDVVRMAMTGTPEKEILRRIAGSDVDFDLSPEITLELRRAGLTEAILEAMHLRQSELPRAVPSPTPAPAASGTLEIDFITGPGASGEPERTASAIEELPPGAARHGGMEVGEVTDLALAILCTTADHVPDHWDTRTPLKDDAPRHEMLLFRPGSVEAQWKGFRIRYLKHDPSYRVGLAIGQHDIRVVVAGRQTGSGAWRPLAADGAAITIAAGRTTRISLEAGTRIRGSSMTGRVPELRWKVAGVEGPDAPDTPSAHENTR